VRLATIDLGTNTVRLLVADVEPGARGWRVVEADQQVTRLGEGLTATGHLAETAAARTATVVGEYVVRARRAGAERLAIVATSAVREAANGPAFAARVERATGERVTIVSGSEEAALTLAGVLEGLPGKTDAEKTLVFDIGGGSSEYILARGAAAIAEASLRLGVVDLAERYPFTDPVDWPRYRRMCAEIAERLQAGLPQLIRAGGVDRVVGTAGTATTLARLRSGAGAGPRAFSRGCRATAGAARRADPRGARAAAVPGTRPGRPHRARNRHRAGDARPGRGRPARGQRLGTAGGDPRRPRRVSRSANLASLLGNQSIVGWSAI
jgi:exopolyphosphatase / guanosine-5'-triphosphate,3'-diphosphate pyrophosphatase